MAARRAEVKAIARARINERQLLVKAESLNPARILVDPRVFQSGHSKLPQALKTKARYSVVKLAMLCGPITRRGRLSPTDTASQCGDTPSRFDRYQARRVASMSASSAAVHLRGAPADSSYMPRFSASAAR